MKRGLQSRQPKVVEPSRAIDSPYLTSEEAVRYLRLRTLSSLYRLIEEHALPHGRRGRLHLFDKRELDAWIRGTTVIEQLRRRA